VGGLLLVVACAGRAAAVDGPAPETVAFGSFGDVTLIRTAPRPAHVVILFSDAAGWDATTAATARDLAALDALVVGVDLPRLLPRLESGNAPCVYPAGDCEQLSQFVQQKLGYPDYVTPVVAGVGGGAALAYTVLAQAPSNTFLGGIGFDFCPRFATRKPLCKGNGLVAQKTAHGYRLRPDENLSVPWIAIGPRSLPGCSYAEIDTFMTRIPGAQMVVLGDGETRTDALGHAFASLLAAQQTTPPPSLSDLDNLPLVEVPAPDGAPVTDLLAIHLTGDGGWGVTDKGLSAALAGSGIPVVGFNTLRYFWQARTPEEAASALGRVLDRYLAAWGKTGVVLVGYSFGADVLPFMVNRLTPATRERIRLIALIGPSRDVRFQFHFSQWMGRSGSDALPTLPEVEKLRGMNILCLYGDKEGDSLCQDVDSTAVKVVERAGGHRILWSFKPVAAEILNALPSGR
jgi:type IV secretory pathway VirJ component